MRYIHVDRYFMQEKGNMPIIPHTIIYTIKYGKITSKERPEQQNCKCCRLGLIELVQKVNGYLHIKI